MDVTFREFEPYYTLEVNSPFDDSPDTSGMRREGESRSSDGERQVHVPCTIVVEELVEEPEDEDEIEPEGGETQAQGELRVYTRRRRQNDVEVPVVPVVPASPLSRPTPTPETPTPSTSNSNYIGDMIPLPSPNPTILRRTSRSNAGHPPDRFGFPHDIAQFVSYSNITSPVHRAFITSLDIVSIPKSWQIYCRPTYAYFEKNMLRSNTASHFPLKNHLIRLVCTSIYVVLITLIAAAMPFFGDFVSICGAIGFTPLDFVFPALAYLKSGRMPKNMELRISVQILNLAIATWFSVVAVLGCIGAVRFIVEDIKTYKFFHDM
ncbi:hypothetical protein DKX38_008429 [Salix brachista]|uniref:Amino acid transporter transmembrane domain-containing protein n=1 Tax=Salix brachista TaxID=2182728 RepID=A0A5N5MQS9_9ROSI|nr:hypothetical protein DKX38_008429 [Salix brachista]